MGKFIETPLKDCYVYEPKVYKDSRGHFLESFSIKEWEDFGLNTNFVQDNESYSQYGTIRGLHFQKGEMSQAKLVRVLKGKVIDVVIDLRQNSPSFLKSYSVELTSENKKQLFVPRGYAHGFAVLSKDAVFSYKCDNYYAPGLESGIHYSDSELGINWKIPKEQRVVSPKDLSLPMLGDISEFF